MTLVCDFKNSMIKPSLTRPRSSRGGHRPRVPRGRADRAGRSRLNPVVAKRAERVYHRTDTHWNKRGALLAYLEMARWIAEAKADETKLRRLDKALDMIERGEKP